MPFHLPSRRSSQLVKAMPASPTSSVTAHHHSVLYLFFHLMRLVGWGGLCDCVDIKVVCPPEDGYPSQSNVNIADAPNVVAATLLPLMQTRTCLFQLFSVMECLYQTSHIVLRSLRTLDCFHMHRQSPTVVQLDRGLRMATWSSWLLALELDSGTGTQWWRHVDVSLLLIDQAKEIVWLPWFLCLFVSWFLYYWIMDHKCLHISSCTFTSSLD